jgi:hypothetical protein
MNRLVLAVIILLTCSLAAAQSTDPEPELAVTLRSMKSSYRITEEIQLEVELLNAGHRSFLVRRQLGWGYGRTDIGVFDSKGKQVVTTVLADELPPPPVAEDFLKLGPHEFFGVLVQEPITNFVNDPGTYQFVVNYTSHVSDEWVRDLDETKFVGIPSDIVGIKYCFHPEVPGWENDVIDKIVFRLIERLS